MFGLPQEVLALVEYCVAERGNRISVAYLDKVAEGWSEEGVNTLEKAQQKIEGYKSGIGRGKPADAADGPARKIPGKTEMDLYNKWTEKWGFTHEAIEFVMKGKGVFKDQPFKYLDAILRSLYDRGITSSRKINEFYTAQKERRANIEEILTALKYSRIVVAPARAVLRRMAVSGLPAADHPACVRAVP